MVNVNILKTDIRKWHITENSITTRQIVFEICNENFKIAQFNLSIYSIHNFSVNDNYLDRRNCRIERSGSKQFLFIMLNIRLNKLKSGILYMYIHVYKMPFSSIKRLISSCMSESDRVFFWNRHWFLQIWRTCWSTSIE